MAAQLAEKLTIPPHVPPELVHPVGLTYGPEFLAAPHDYMASFHEQFPPIFYCPSEMTGNAWFLLKHADCFFALRHPEIFTTAGATPFPRDPDNYFPMVPLEIDPPGHRKYRAVLDPMFSPQAVLRLEGTIRKLANDLIDKFIDRGECEFTAEFGRPLPVSVFLDLMGLPQEMRDTFVKWAMGLLHSQSREIAAQSMEETCAYLASAIEEKKRKPDNGAV